VKYFDSYGDDKLAKALASQERVRVPTAMFVYAKETEREEIVLRDSKGKLSIGRMAAGVWESS
jgi:hypothetical protein